MVDEFSSKYPDDRFSMEMARRRPRTPFSQPSPPPSSEAQLDLKNSYKFVFQQKEEKCAKASFMTAEAEKTMRRKVYQCQLSEWVYLRFSEFAVIIQADN